MLRWQQEMANAGLIRQGAGCFCGNDGEIRVTEAILQADWNFLVLLSVITCWPVNDERNRVAHVKSGSHGQAQLPLFPTSPTVETITLLHTPQLWSQLGASAAIWIIEVAVLVEYFITSGRDRPYVSIWFWNVPMSCDPFPRDPTRWG